MCGTENKWRWQCFSKWRNTPPQRHWGRMEWPWQLPPRDLPMDAGGPRGLPWSSFQLQCVQLGCLFSPSLSRSMCIYTLHHLTSDAFMSLNFTKIHSHILDLPSSCFSPFLFQFVPLFPYVVKCFCEFAYSQARCHTGQPSWSPWPRVSGLRTCFLFLKLRPFYLEHTLASQTMNSSFSWEMLLNSWNIKMHFFLTEVLSRWIKR